MAKPTKKPAVKASAKAPAKGPATKGAVAKAKGGSRPAASRVTPPAKVHKITTKATAKPAPAPAKVVSAKSAAAKPAPAKVVTLKSAPASSPVKASPTPPKVAAKVSASPGIKMGSRTTASPEAILPVKPKSADGKPTNGKPARVPGGTLIPAPAPVNPKGKPGKNQAGLSAKELDVFRDLLLQKRRELVGDMYSMEREALQRNGENLSNLPLHMADMGTDNYEQEFTLGLMEKDRQLLREINVALAKILDGRYGICEGTGKPISKARLEVQPWAKYSIEHARKLENRGVR